MVMMMAVSLIKNNYNVDKTKIMTKIIDKKNNDNKDTDNMNGNSYNTHNYDNAGTHMLKKITRDINGNRETDSSGNDSDWW